MPGAPKQPDPDIVTIGQQIYSVDLRPLESAALLESLHRIPLAQKITARLAQNLQSVADEGWIRLGDLHEVFAVLDALAAYKPELVHGARLAHAMQRLIACEQQPGGPYLSATGRLEVSANVVISRFLGRFDVELPLLQQYLDSHKIDRAIRPRADVATLSPTVRELLGQIQALQTQSADVVAATALSAGTSSLQAAILDQAKQYVQSLPSPLRQTGLRVWDEMRRADRNHEIVLMPQMFADMLTNKSVATYEQLQLLGTANFFCWIATILYDDFIDEEGDPARLPIANVAYRRSLALYRRALDAQPELYGYVEDMYDAVDRANAWEVANTRARVAAGSIHLGELPDYGNYVVLADRAFGHAIGPMLLVQQLPGVWPAQIQHVQSALGHYLIARQLNDDIHDWRKDLNVGQLSAVVVMLLHGAGVGPGVYRLTSLTSQLEQYFFGEGLAKLCEQLMRHTDLCRQALRASKLTRSVGGFMNLVGDLEASARAAMDIQDNRRAFLATYQKLAT